MDAIVTWKDAMNFEGTGSGTGFTVPMGSRPEDGEPAQGASPMELVLIALGGCSGMDVVDILHKKRQDVTHFEIKLHGDRAEDYPKVYTHITVEYVVTGHHLDPEAVNRSVELSVTKYCSVMGMLAKAANVEHTVTIVEAD